MLYIVLALIALIAITATIYFVVSDTRIRMVSWRNGEQWVRAFPNPGFRIGQKQWSKRYGKGVR